MVHGEVVWVAAVSSEWVIMEEVNGLVVYIDM